MNSNNLQLDRKSQPPRRIGLSRNGYRSAPLLSTFNGPKKETAAPDNMPPKATNSRTRQLNAKKASLKQEEVEKWNSQVEEEDINAPPKESSDEGSTSEDEKRSRSVSIKPTNFGPTKATLKTEAFNGRGTNSAKPAVSGNTSVRNMRSARNISSSISGNSGSPKRKSQEDAVPSSSAKDVFGNYVSGAKRTRTTYGSSQSKRFSSSQVTGPKLTQDNLQSPPKSFVNHLVPLTPEKAETLGKTFFMPKADGLDSPDASPGSSNKATTPLQTPSKLRSLIGAIPDSDDDAEEPNFDGLHGLDSPTSASHPPREENAEVSKYLFPATQAQEFKNYSLDDSFLLSQVKEILSKDQNDELKTSWRTQPEDYHLTQTEVLPVCPMCRAPVDPQELQAQGRMNTRAQERFCQSHQRKTAKEEWKERGYPEIDWETLPSKLSKYRKNIQKWINGADSHYRQQYGAKTAAGQDRTLRKLTSNLIPGYYGSRGLQVISDFIMQNNTKLLKKVAPKDRLMSKSSVTAYVQSVLVPEVTTLLIMEDMSVDEESARRVLEESAAMGELLQEEIRDVHVSRVEDSEDDEDELA